MPNTLSHLANTNIGCSNPSHFKLDALFIYNTILIKIYPTLVSQILASYNANPW